MPQKQTFVEKTAKGSQAVRKPNAKRASAIEPTQSGAIKRARAISPAIAPDVERVRNTSGGRRDHWRKA